MSAEENVGRLIDGRPVLGRPVDVPGEPSADGRHVDLSAGILSGEASTMRGDRTEQGSPMARVDRNLPVESTQVLQEDVPTYYGMPAVKPPPWEWYVPAYFTLGGMAGAALVLAAVAQLSGRESLRPVVSRARWVGLLGVGAGSVFLVADLGRPERFLYMLRVFRPTSTLNMGSWIIGASGTSALAAVGLQLVGARRLADAAGLAAGASGALLGTYTAVVLTDTAIPLWSSSRRTMPFLFAASSAASAASALSMTGEPDPVVEAVGVAGKIGEIAAMVALEAEIADERVRRPLKAGRSGWLWFAAKALGVASLAASLWPRKGRRGRMVAGALGVAAAATMRYALVEAGKASARDPRATFEPQRRTREQRERRTVKVTTIE